jgi:mono/diheme cytochrome c family protein
MTRICLLQWLVVFGGLLTAIFPGRCHANESEKVDPEVIDQGRRIFAESCAVCHGEQAEGVKDAFPQPLTGDKSLRELTQLIVKTMPEGDAEACTGDDATAVATFLYEEFYSPAAQIRRSNARRDLARLTVNQHRQVLADLIGEFRREGVWDEKRGLRGRYYADKAPRGNEKINRFDETVAFDFGEGTPGDGFKKEEFSARWIGGVLAPDTGEYEFIIETENAGRLWVNNEETPLIDAYVKSGDEKRYIARTFLIAGRVYPLKLEFYNRKEKTASIKLIWKRPHRAEEVIPGRLFTPNDFSEVFVCSTPFPPDDKSAGYERGTAVSKEWFDATSAASVETAGYVAANLGSLAGTKSTDGNYKDKVREFCRQFAEFALRRPISEEERNHYVDRWFEEASAESAAKKSILFTLGSPRFLYRELAQDNSHPLANQYVIAERLAFALCDGLPDKPLREAAAKGKLHNPIELRRHAERLLKDFRCRAKLQTFFAGYLGMEHMQDIAKDTETFPEFNPQLASNMITSLELFVDDILWSNESDFRQLFLSEDIYLDGKLAEFYGFELPADAAFQKVQLDAGRRGGVVTHPALLTGLAYHSESSPIHRGVFVARGLLGRSLLPPPIAVAPLAPDLHVDLTTRERVDLQTSADTCQRCHGMINKVGFALENFDAVGRYREKDNEKPVDASGSYISRSGEDATFNGGRELAVFLAQSSEVHAAFVDQLYHHIIKQPILVGGGEKRENYQQFFAQNDYNMQKLLLEIAMDEALELEKSRRKRDN